MSVSMPRERATTRAQLALRYLRKVITLADAMLFDFLINMETQLTWYGHAAFKIKTVTGKILLIDPWVTNPSFARGKDELTSLDRVDVILLTHEHSDHVVNEFDMGQRTGEILFL